MHACFKWYEIIPLVTLYEIIPLVTLYACMQFYGHAYTYISLYVACMYAFKHAYLHQNEKARRALSFLTLRMHACINVC